MSASKKIELIGNNTSDLRSKKHIGVFISTQLKNILPFSNFILLAPKPHVGKYNVYLTDLKNEDNDINIQPEFCGITMDVDFIRLLSVIDQPTFFDIDQMQEAHPSLFLRELENLAFTSFVALTLSYEGQMPYILLLLSKSELLISEHYDILKMFTIQLSAALSVVGSLERIKQVEFEKEVLLTIIEDISSINNLKSLLPKIYERLKLLIPCDDILVTGIESDKERHYFQMRIFEGNKTGLMITDDLIQNRFTIRDGLLSKMMISNEPVIFDEKILLETETGRSFYNLYWREGIRQVVAIALRRGNDHIGVLYIGNESMRSYTQMDLSIIKGVSLNLNLAMSNMLAIEASSASDKEKSVLLALSSDIATIRDQKQLLQVLQSKIKKLLPFNDIIITLYNYELNTHSAFLFYCEDKRTNHPSFKGISEKVSPISDGVVNETILSDNPVIFQVEDLLNNKFISEYIKFYKETEIQEFAGVSLRNKDGIFGGMYILSESKNTYNPKQFNLIKGIANQLSITVSNLLAYEEITRKEKEKTILLAISNDLATIKGRSDLLNILHNRLISMFYFDHAVISLTNNIRQVYTGYIFDPSARCVQHPDYLRLRKNEYALGDTLMTIVMDSTSPIVIDIETAIKYHDCPGYILMNYDCGMREIVYAKLHSGNELIGFLILFSDFRNSFSPAKLELIRGVSYQLSNAVANNVANDEILNREQDKSILLSISNDLAAVRNKADLYQVLEERMRNIFQYSNILLGKVSDDGNWVTPNVLDPTSENEDLEYKEIVSGRFKVNDGLIDAAFLAGRPLVFKLNEQLEKGELPNYLNINYDQGMKEVVLVGLSNGQRKTGLLAIFTSQSNQITFRHLNLIQGMSSQLATAMANILANEKIEQQVIEISNFRKQLEVENLYLQEEIQTSNNYSEIIGDSTLLQRVFQLVSSVAPTTSSVLILGETGTGKELIARAIHNTSPRKGKLMVKVNCATLPANLIESELFGHEKGSFTGATDRRIGKFELANNSTLFLDEIGEMPLDLQVKLLRALQEKEIERVGGRTVIKTDVRIIAATNRDLQKEVQLGNFRSDLFFRLNVFPIQIPPLRDRREDIPLLSSHFLAKHAKKAGKKILGFSSRVMKELGAYSWPGNVRELEHLIERSILLATSHMITQLHLPTTEKEEIESYLTLNNVRTIDEVEREHIISILKLCNGKVRGIGGAAEALKIPSTTLNSKIKRLGIKKEYSID